MGYNTLVGQPADCNRNRGVPEIDGACARVIVAAALLEAEPSDSERNMASTLLHSAIKCGQDDPTILIRAALQLCVLGEFEEARRIALHAGEIRPIPDSAPVATFLHVTSVIAQVWGDEAGATATFAEALAHHRESRESQVSARSLARLYGSQGREREARTVLPHQLGGRTGDPRWHRVTRGPSRRSRLPNKHRKMLERAVTHRRRGDEARASRLVARVNKRCGRDPDCHLEAALATLEPWPDLAKEYLRQAVEVAPEDPVILTQAASLSFYHREFESARRWLEAAKRHAPPGFVFENDLVWLEGRLASLRGDDDLALHALSRAFEQDPEGVDVGRALAEFHASRGRPIEGLEVALEALAHRPNDPALGRTKARILEHLGVRPD